jgi:hypothetical protein
MRGFGRGVQEPTDVISLCRGRHRPAGNEGHHRETAFAKESGHGKTFSAFSCHQSHSFA